MVKCKKCGDFISDEFEICYECKNSTNEEIKERFEKNRDEEIWNNMSSGDKFRKEIQADGSWKNDKYLFGVTNLIAKKLSISNIYSRAIIFHSLAVTYMLISFYICSWIPLIGVYIAYAPAIGFFIYGYRLYYFIYKRVLVSNATKLIKTSLLLVLFSPLIYIGIYLPILFFLSYNGYLN
tara:strand:- start:960 stop:1499 length:540 start_codon:yes stop_codon:yes gene_type:complete